MRSKKRLLPEDENELFGVYAQFERGESFCTSWRPQRDPGCLKEAVRKEVCWEKADFGVRLGRLRISDLAWNHGEKHYLLQSSFACLQNVEAVRQHHPSLWFGEQGHFLNHGP